MQTQANTKPVMDISSRLRWVAGTLLVVSGWLFLPASGWSACQTISVSAFYYSSWDAYGIQNQISVEESRLPTSIAGKGPYSDRYSGGTRLSISQDVLGFQIPQLTGTVAAAELRLKVREFVSLRGSEVYQWHSINQARVRLEIHRLVWFNLYDDYTLGTDYGSGTVGLSERDVTITLNSEFLSTVAAAAGRRLVMEGSFSSLDGDPLNPQYLTLETGATNYAVLVLTMAGTGGPEIVRGPASRVAPAGGDVELSVLACGEPPLAYQWQFQDLDIPGATNANLFLSGVTPGEAGNYGVVISNALGTSKSSETALMVIENAPFFVSQPGGGERAAGDTNGFLRAVVGGSPLPACQWQLNGTDLPGATNNVLRLGPATMDQAGSYTLVASNASGSLTSNPARVTIVPFYCSGGPYDEAALLGLTVYLGVSFSGPTPPDTIQWYFNQAPVMGATNNLLEFTASMETAGSYFVIAANAYGAITSRVATVSVSRQAPEFTAGLYDQTFVAGTTNELVVDTLAGPPATYYWFFNGQLIPGEYGSWLSLPNMTMADAGYYSVVASNEVGVTRNGPATVTVVPARVSVSHPASPVSAGYPTVLYASYEGVSPAFFQWQVDGQDLPGQTNFVLILPAFSELTEGEYRVVVSNCFGTVASELVPLDVAVTPARVYGVADVVEKRVGDFAWLTAFFEGSPRPVCQWKHNGEDIPGATNRVLALENISPDDSGTYSVVISNGVVPPPGIPSTRLVVLPAGPLDVWAPMNPIPQSNPLDSVACGNGRRVAVGQHGAVAVSTDGQNWTAHHLGPGIHLQRIAFGNGRFVTLGDAATPFTKVPVLLSSADGVSWSAHSVPVQGELSGVAFGNNRFLVIGGQEENSSGVQVLLVSEDGQTWHKQALPGEMALSDLSGICFGNGLFIVVSEAAAAYSPWPMRHTIFVSAEGLNWTAANANLTASWEAVAPGEGAFLAVGDNVAMGRSVDGLNWNVRMLPGDFGSLKDAAFGNGMYLVFGEGNTALISYDGLAWQGFPYPSVHEVNGVAFGEGRFTAVTDAGRILVSTNGVSWTDQCLGPDADLYGIAQGPNGFVAVGDNALLVSSNGTHWTQLPYTRKLRRVTYGNGLFVAVGKRGTILTSPDGLNWTTRPAGAEEYLEAVIWANERFVAVGEAGLMFTSADGTNWTRLPMVNVGDLESIAYGNGTFVGVGGYFDIWGAVSSIVTSTDGVHWTDHLDAYYFGIRARGVTFGNGKFVLVGNDGLVAVSTNGADWDRDTLSGENFRAVTYVSGYFIAVGNDGRVASSTNGMTWERHRSPASMNLRDVVATTDAVIAVGSNGTILRSGELRPELRGGVVASGFQLDVSGGLMPEYRVQASSDLRRWDELFTYSNNTKGTFVDQAARELPARYYRLVPVTPAR